MFVLGQQSEDYWKERSPETICQDCGRRFVSTLMNPGMHRDCMAGSDKPRLKVGFWTIFSNGRISGPFEAPHSALDGWNGIRVVGPCKLEEVK